MGTLYLVATPIGNLEDLSLRAIRILREVDLIAAEDTRHTGHLLKHYDITTPVLSYHAHNERSRRERLLAALATGDVALVSDAGSPGISDPGFDLVNAAIAAGHHVSPVPGASAVIAAVTASGLVPGPFLALGFLPRKGRERQHALAAAISSGYPFVLFEAPARLVSTLRELAAATGDRLAAVCRELTKLHEEIERDQLSRLATHYEEAPPRGEIVIVIAAAEAETVAEDDAAHILRTLLDQGLGPSQAAKAAALQTGLARSSLYQLAQSLRHEQASAQPARDGET